MHGNIPIRVNKRKNILVMDSSVDEHIPTNEKWTNDSKPNANDLFTEDVGPNIPEGVKSPSEICLHIFTDELVDLIVEQKISTLNKIT